MHASPDDTHEYQDECTERTREYERDIANRFRDGHLEALHAVFDWAQQWDEPLAERIGAGNEDETNETAWILRASRNVDALIQADDRRLYIAIRHAAEAAVTREWHEAEARWEAEAEDDT